MAADLLTPVFTENFDKNLIEIELFLNSEGKKAFEHLLDRLFDDIVPTLCQFPQAGRSFLNLDPYSLEAEKLAKQLKSLIKKTDALRQFVLDDYLILYLIRGRKIYFLSIKHHRQLSFNLQKFW